jgi:hypothetical protein
MDCRVKPGNDEQKHYSPRLLIPLSSSICKNISASLPTQITSFISAVLFLQRGGSRSSRTRDGMRWTLVVPITNGIEADGEDVWS